MGFGVCVCVCVGGGGVGFQKIRLKRGNMRKYGGVTK